MTTPEYEAYKYEQAAEWLKHVRSTGEKVASTQALIESERELMDGVRAVDYSVQGGGGTTDPDAALAETIARIEGHIREYVTLLAEYEAERIEARRHLCKLESDAERRALTLHFLLGWKWERVCLDMHYSYDGIMQLRRRAIVHAYDVMPLELRDPLHKAL